MSSSPPPAAVAEVSSTTELEPASPATTEPVLSKTQQRKLARQLALAEVEAAAASSEGVSRPQGPAMSVEEAEERLDSVGSACGAVLGKRIKLLNKKAQRHQTYKDIPTASLNPDQVQALSKLDGLVATIKELEEMKKAVEVAELEQAAALRAKKYFDAAQSEAHFSHLQTLLALSRLHAILFPSSSSPSSSSSFAPSALPPSLANLTAQEVAAVGSLQHALVARQQVGLVVELAKGETESAVLEGVSFARVLEIVRSLPEPEPEAEADEQPSVEAKVKPNTSRCYQPPIQFGSSSLLDETDPAVPTSTSTGRTSPDAAAAVQHASFASGGGCQQQMSFGTAVEASAPPSQQISSSPDDNDDVRGKAGLEGEGETLAAVDETAAANQPAVPAPAEDADAVVERLRVGAGGAGASSLDWAADEPPAMAAGGGDGTVTPGGSVRKARGPRGPRNRGGKTANAAAAATVAGETTDGQISATVGGEKPKQQRVRAPRQPKSTAENGPSSAAASAAANDGNGGEQRRRAPRPPRNKEGGSGRATPTMGVQQQQQQGASTNRRNGGGNSGNGGGGGGARREPNAASGGEATARPPRSNGNGAERGGVRTPRSGRGGQQAGSAAAASAPAKAAAVPATGSQ